MFTVGLSAVAARGVESSVLSFLRRTAGSLPKPITDASTPTITEGRQAFDGDLRSTSGLGTTDGITSHTRKWLQGADKSPIEMLREEPPKKVKGLKVASVGGEGDDHVGLGCPIEYIDLRGTTPEKPAVCKYTGNKYYSDDWIGGGAH